MGAGGVFPTESSAIEQPLEPDLGNSSVGKRPTERESKETLRPYPVSGVAFVLTGADLRAMKITVNGEERGVPEGLTVSGLLAELGISSRGRAVELNKNVVFRQEHETTRLKEGDRVEIITMVGGG